MDKTNWKISLSIIFLMFLGLVVTSPTLNAQNLPIVSVTGPVDALTTLSNDVAALPPSAFAKRDYQKKLLHMINATIDEVEDGAYYRAIRKLYHIEDKIDKWINTDPSSLIADVKVAITAIRNASETTVPTWYGQVAGADAGNNSWIWEGVPYAKPPIGRLRWKAPQDPDPWHGVRQSTSKFSPATQPNMSTLWFPLTATPIGSEDCLYLNIFRPKNAGRHLPVFVWIHGGGNVFGQASIYNASLLASQGNMIVVVIQYRLGPFGFFYFPALNPHGTAEDQSGNYGTLDTIKAVQWVKNNIRSFGGNPHNITVGGQSAGGFNTLTLLTSPLAKGLFQQAFVMSAGGTAVTPSTTPVYSVYEKLTGKTSVTGISDAKIAAYLRAQPTMAIEGALMVNGSLPLGTFNPSIDGTVITDTFVNLITAGNYSQIPIMIGNTEYEEKPFLPLYVWGGVFADGTTPGPGFVFAPSQTTFNDIWTTVNPATNSAIPAYIYEACGFYASLDWKAVMVDQLATSMVGFQPTDVYAYHFVWGAVSYNDLKNNGNGSDLDTDIAFLYGAGHASDIPFFFGWNIDVYGLPTFNYTVYNPPYGLGLFNSSNQTGRVALSQAMMSYLANFVASGNPNGSGPTTWYPWGSTSNTPPYRYISLDATATATNISMQTDSYTKAVVVALVEALPSNFYPDAVKTLILGFFTF
jgi:para-nitrobenzyl esterase